MSTVEAHRPIGVAVVGWVTIIQGVFNIATGIGLFIERNNASLTDHIGVESSTIGTYAWVAIIWGVVALFTGWSLLGGAGWARLLVAILQVAHIASGVYVLFAWEGQNRYDGLGQIVVGLIVLFLLFNQRADRFFASR